MFTRRDMLTYFLGAPAAIAACQREPEPVDTRIVGGSSEHGHRLRDMTSLPEVPADRVEKKRVVIVGAGPSGLTAAWLMQRSGFHDVVVLDAEPRPGGTSAWGDVGVAKHPYGAHYLPLPLKENRALIALLNEMHALDGVDEHGEPVGAEHLLVRDPEERLFMHGYWQQGLLPRPGATPDDLRQIHAFSTRIGEMARLTDGKGRRAFSLPLQSSSDDAELTALDKLTFKEWLLKEGFTSKRVHWMADYACRDDHGAKVDHTSAWVGLFYFCSRWRPGAEESAPFLTWPEGNGRLVQHLLKPVQDRVRLRSVVIDVNPVENGVEVLAFDETGPRKIVAERVILATPKPLTARMVRPFRDNPPEHLGAFKFGSWLVANVHLRSRPKNRGFEVAWDNVFYDSPSLGYVVATHQRGPDTGPTVWTWYLPITDPDVKAARKNLLAMSAKEAGDVVLQDLGRAHADLRERVERIDIFKHGHAMVRPEPGFMWGPHRRKAAEALGPIHFAHCDLSGLPLFEEAFDQGLRAAREVLTALQVPVVEPA